MSSTNATKDTRTDKDFQLALRRIYEVYGPNLDAFFSDVQKKLNLERTDDQQRRLTTDRMKIAPPRKG